jgi:hypothetical protein
VRGAGRADLYGKQTHKATFALSQFKLGDARAGLPSPQK